MSYRDENGVSVAEKRMSTHSLPKLAKPFGDLYL